MGKVIAVAGKGGVGKSTLSAVLVDVLAEKGNGIVLAVDADPNANLGEKLGVTVEHTIGELREELLKNADNLPAGMSKHDYVRYQIRMALQEGERFDLITMGRSEGPGCYCYINNILRTFLDEMMDDYPYIVIDNEAGMEHLSRRTTRHMDVLLIVSDATKLGVQTAARIRNLAMEMEINVGKEVLVINRITGDIHTVVKEAISKMGFEEVVLVPMDSKVEELTVVGEPLTELDRMSPVRRELSRLVQKIDL